MNERWINIVERYKNGEMRKEYDPQRGWVLPCSTSEQLMIGLATDERDLLLDWDGFEAYQNRLNDEQREVVDHYRSR